MAKKHPHDIESYINGKEPVVMEIYAQCGLDTIYNHLYELHTGTLNERLKSYV